MVKENINMEVLNFEQKYSIDVGFEAKINNDKILLTISDDWAGDSITGFGSFTSFEMDRKQAIKLRDFLSQFIERRI